jgi:putative flippase GtrA
VLYGSLRSVASAQVANLVALAATAIANTTANRRLTFGVRGRDGFLADQLAGLAAFAIALGITSGAIGLLAIAAPDAQLPVEITVVVTANVAATIVRFLVLRGWLERGDPSHRSRVPEGAPR